MRNNRDLKSNKLTIQRFTLHHTPGIKKCPVEEAAVVVVAHKVSRDRLPGAGLRHHLIGHRDPVSGVVEVQKYDVKHQGRLSWDVAAWRQKDRLRKRSDTGVETEMKEKMT